MRRPPLSGRLTLWRHRRRGHTVRVNDTISVPMWDRHSVGILAECSCGKEWAW